MTQRIFDIENKKDMQDLWDILPDDVKKLKKNEPNTEYSVYIYSDSANFITKMLKINWHDATEITRPVDYEKMIGCVGWFWDNDDEEKLLGILTRYYPEAGFPFIKGNNGCSYFNFLPAKKSELKFWGE